MGLEAIKKELIDWVKNLKNEQTLEFLKSIKQSEANQQNPEKVECLSLEGFNKEIDQALEDSKNDRGIEASELKNKIKNWGLNPSETK